MRPNSDQPTRPRRPKLPRFEGRTLRNKKPALNFPASQILGSQVIASEPGGEKGSNLRSKTEVKKLLAELEAENLRVTAELIGETDRLGGKLQYGHLMRGREIDSFLVEKQMPDTKPTRTEVVKPAAGHRLPKTKEEHGLHFWELMVVDKNGATVRTASSVKDSV